MGTAGLVSILPFLLTTLSGSPAVDKAPVPEQGAQILEETRIKDLFKEEYAKRSPQDRINLAEKLIRLGKETPKDPVKRFVLFREARDLAVEAGEAQLAFQAIDLLSESFRIDPLAMKVEAHSKLSRGARTPQALKSLAEMALALIEEAFGRDQYETATGLASKAAVLAQKLQDASLLFLARAAKDKAEALKGEYSRIEGALKTLKENPEDPAANLAAGKFFSFFKGDWDRGLRHLTRSKDPALKAIAEKDLSGPKKASPQIELGNGWAEISSRQTGISQETIRMRALKWYEEALPGLSGLERADVLKRISSVFFSGSPIWETRSGEPGTVLGGEGANVEKNFTIEFWISIREPAAPLLTKRLKEQDSCLTILLGDGRPVVLGDGSFYRVEGRGEAQVNDGGWHHLAAVKSNARVQVFVDGRPACEFNTLPRFSSTSAWVLNRDGTHGLRSVDARFARIRFSKVARYTGPFSPRGDYGSDKETVLLK